MLSSYLEAAVRSYNELMKKRDHRTDGWLLMSSPFPTLLLCIGYVYFIKDLGPKLMKNRPAFQLKAVIIVYNAMQVALSWWIFYKALKHGWLFKYNYTCQPCDYSDDPDAVAMAQNCWWYYITKFVEFLDTVFFVVRKKPDQITALHLIHHGVMPFFSWWGVKFSPGGHGTFSLLFNTFVHVVMYSYYLLAAMGPQYMRYLWWKKYLTWLQLVQFTIVLIHNLLALLNGCDYSKPLLYLQCFTALMFFSLFSNFYIQAYIKRRRLPKTTTTATENVVVNYFSVSKEKKEKANAAGEYEAHHLETELHNDNKKER